MARRDPTVRVEAPEDVRRALEAGGLWERFAALPPSHRREHLGYIDEAVKAETRARRIVRTIASSAREAKA